MELEKWEPLLTKFVTSAVEKVQPSSRIIGDCMDINEYVKVKILDW